MKGRFLALTLLRGVNAAVAQCFPKGSEGPGERQLGRPRIACEQRRAETMHPLAPELTASQLKKFEVLLTQHRGHDDAPSAFPN